MALERLTSDRLVGQVTVVVGGEVVTTHKLRSVIKGGDVQITLCAAGSADLLLGQLLVHQKTMKDAQPAHAGNGAPAPDERPWPSKCRPVPVTSVFLP